MPKPANDPNPYASPTTESASATAASGAKQYAPCPSCGGVFAKKISWTLWGGVIGPALLTHVKCANCGTAYNGKTGRSNATAITVFLVVGIVLGLMIGIALAIANHR